jgi:hypothetical protein
LSNLLRHVVEDKDDLSAGKKKSAHVRKTMMTLEDDDERRRSGVRGR